LVRREYKALWLLTITLPFLCGFAASRSAQSQVQLQHPAQPPTRLAHRRFLARRGIAAGAIPRTQRPAAALKPFLLPQTTISTTWTAIGPLAVTSQSYGLVTGRIASIALDPSDATGNTVYLGTTGGGVWKSQNAASSSASFTPITDSQSALTGQLAIGLSVGAVSVQPGGTGVLLAGLGDPNDALDSYYGAGILRSTNSGQTWTLIQQTVDLENGLSNQDYSFVGEGFSAFAWSTTNPQLVVAAVSQAYEATLVNATVPTSSYQGLYYSADSGATWHLARITDGSGSDIQGPNDPFAGPDGNAVTSVIWNSVRQLFIAAVRYHGYYQSSDGITYTRMAAQPGTNLTTANCPTESGSVGVAGCPIFRGALAVNPFTGDTFAWTIDAFNQDQGIWQDACVISGFGSTAVCTNPTITFASQLNTAALETTGEGGDATIPNGDYNLTLAAIPSQQDTLLFAGANDLYRCSIANSCQWRNTTNATSCLSAQVAPYQHAIAWSTANPLLLYLGNDSGLWRSTDDVGETGSPCASTDASHFQNLNSGLGSLAEIESLAQPASTASTLVTGLGANGAAAIVNASSTASDWNQILGGEGGPVGVDPSVTTNNWYVNNAAGVSILSCSAVPGSACTPASFGTIPAVGESQVLDDGLGMTEPAPFTFDLLDTTQLLVGTCRLWRGPKSGSGWAAANAISPVLDGSPTTYDCSGNSLIRSLAAAQTSSGETLYVGMAGTNDVGGLVAGHLFTATLNTSGSLAGAWTDLTSSSVTNTGQPFNPSALDISTLYVDPHDATAQTLYVAASGFDTATQTIQQLYRTINGGASWINIASNIPNAPINDILVDPQDPTTIYIGTDVGVYITRSIATCPTTACWSAYGSGLPLVPVTNLTTAAQTLTAATYGRGAWQTPLVTAGTTLTTATATPTSLTYASTAVGSSATAQTITFKNTGSATLTLTSFAFTGADPSDFTVTSSCIGVSIAKNATCTASITFTPTAVGTRTATFAAAANVSGGQLLIALTGTAVAPASLSFNPPSLSFGSIQVSTVSAAQSISVQNNGGQAVTISSTTVSSPFIRTATTCGSSLAANTSCAITLTFNPTTAGSYTGTLTLKDSLGTQTLALTGTALSAPTDSLSTNGLAFPSTVIGQSSSPLTVTLTNSGGEPLTNIGTSLSGTSASQFSVTSNCSTTLSPASSCAFSVVFSPISNTTLTGTLVITDSLRAQSVSLKGNGLKPPVLSLSKSSLSFPGTQQSVTSSPLTLTISNTGGAPLVQPSFAFTGSGAAAFTTSATTCGATLAAQASCTVSTTFTPVAAGATSATITVSTSTLGVTPVTATLTGTGLTPPSIGLSPASLNLGSVTVGNSSALFSVHVTNIGQVALNLPTFSIGNLSAGAASDDFALSAPTDITACAAALNPGASCYIQITFTPSVVGTETATLTAASTNAIPASVSIPLIGAGTPPVVLSTTPASLSFGSLSVGVTSATQIITLSNTGRQAASSLTLAFTGPYATVPTLTTCGSTLGIKASCAIGITFTPIASGSQPGSLTLSVSNLDVSPLVIPFSGTGLAVGGIALTPSEMTFGSVLINTASASQTLTITNSGQASLNGLKLQITNSTFSTSNVTCGSTLTAGNSCTAAIAFKTTTTGSQTGTLTVSTTSAGVPPTVLQLSGYGIPAGALTANPTVASFGSVTVGQTGPSQTVTLTNAGPALTSLTFTLAGDYSLPSNTCGTQIVTGAACTFTVSFSPSQPGTRIGSVTVKSTTAGYIPIVVGLTGAGLSTAQLTVSPSQLSFGSVLVGTNSAVLQLTVSNPGTGILTGLGFTTNAPFTVGSGTCPSTLAAGASCGVPVTFSPSTAGAQSVTVTVVTSSLGVNSVTVPVSGTGSLPASLTLTPAGLGFPATTLGATSSAQTITITNPGATSLTGLAFAVSGPFSLQSTTCITTLAATSSCTALLVFKPTVAGSAIGFLTASSTTKSVASVTAALTGPAITPALLAITPSQIAFPATLVGAASSAQKLTITNAGQTTISDLALAVFPPFVLVPASTTCTAALAGGATCTASILFSPTAIGSFTGSLTATSAAADVTASANLTGTGALAPAVVTNPSTLLQFPTTSVGQSATPITVTVTNQGTAASLTGLAISLDANAAAAGFGITASTCTAILAATASCTLQVTLQPIISGTLTGNLVLTSTNGGSTHLALAGFGFSFTFTAIGSTSSTVIPGQTAYFTFAITPLGGTSGTVSFACGQLPSNALCIFNPAQLSGLRATGNVQLGISTTAPTTVAFHPSFSARRGATTLCLLAFFPALFKRIRRNARRSHAHRQISRVCSCLLLMSLAISAILGLASCANSGGSGGLGGLSHSTGGTPTGTYPVTVTATSGGLARTAQVTLIVN
jgi:hypothetical protein